MGNMSRGPYLEYGHEEKGGGPHIERPPVYPSRSRDLWIVIGLIIGVALVVIIFMAIG